MVLSTGYTIHLGVQSPKFIILTGELISLVSFSNMTVASPCLHEALPQSHCAHWASEQIDQDRPKQPPQLLHTLGLLCIFPVVVYFPHGHSSSNGHCCPAPTSSHPCGGTLHTALVLNSLPTEITKSFFIISKSWISCGAGSVETQSVIHNIKNTFPNQNGVEREGEG